MILDIFTRPRQRANSLAWQGRPLALSLTILTAACSFCHAAGAVDKITVSNQASATVAEANAPIAGNYAAARALYDRGRYRAALDAAQKLLEKTTKGQPEYSRLKTLATVAGFKCLPLLEVYATAKDAFESSQGQANAGSVPACNYGVLELLGGDHELSAQIFQKAVQIAPDDFLSHVGLAEVFSMDHKHGYDAALAELGRAEGANNTYGLTQTEKWLTIGDDYMILDQPARALAAYLRAQMPGGKDPDGQISASVCRAALASGQVEVAKPLLDRALHARVVPGDLYVQIARTLCQPTEEGNALAKRIYDAALAHQADSTLLYRLGLAFGKSGQDLYARQSFEEALKYDQPDGKYRLAYAAELARAGQNVMARKQLAIVAQHLKVNEPSAQNNLIKGLTLAGFNLLKEYNSDWALSVRQSLGGKPKPAYKTTYATLTLKCHCHLVAIQQNLNALPGVAFAYLPGEKNPVACVIYDSKVTSPSEIWSKLGPLATGEPINRSEDIQDFPQLVDKALDYAEAPYKLVNPYYVFDILPLRLIPGD